MTMSDDTPSTAAPVRHQCHVVDEVFESVRVLRVSGRLDWATAGKIRDLMRDDCTDPEIVVDLTETDTTDAAGTSALLAATARALRRGQRLVIISDDPILLEVLRSLELDLAVPIVGSLAEGLRCFDDRFQPLAQARS